MRRWWVVVAVVLVILPVVPVVGQATDPQPVSWLSTGDSYSSGEGVFGNRGDCAQSSDAWGRVAANELKDSGWAIPVVGFTACTGHLVEDFFNARDGSKDSLYEWGLEQGVPARVDVLTLSFGGNDIGFADIITGCLDIPASWLGLRDAFEQGVFGALFGCDVSELELQERIDALVEPTVAGCEGRRSVDPGGYRCDLWIGPGAPRGSYVDFLVKLARDHLTTRGRLVVVGYPQLVAPTSEWSDWEQAECQGILREDAVMLGKIAVYFDAKLKTAVHLANERLDTQQVLYISTRDLYRDGSHELCGNGEEWLNGITTARGEGFTFRPQGSFHPNEGGHHATGQAVANALLWEVLASASIPAMCGHEPTQLVGGEDVEVDELDGMFMLLRELWNGSPAMVSLPESRDAPLTAIVARCNAGGVGWPNPIMFFSPTGDYYGHTFLGDYDWASIDLAGPRRNGVLSLKTDDQRRLIVELSMYGLLEGGGGGSGSATVAVEARGGRIFVTDVLAYDPGIPWGDPQALGREYFDAWRSWDEDLMQYLSAGANFIPPRRAIPDGRVRCAPHSDGETMQCEIVASTGELYFVLVGEDFGMRWRVNWAGISHIDEGGCC